MSETKYTHQTHINYKAGRCFLQWNGARGNVLATGADGQTKVWIKNPDGHALLEAMKWCRAGCPQDKAPDKPKPRTHKGSK